MNADPPSTNATWQLLHRFAESGCDRSFRALFDSHAGLVYHAALRTGRGDRQLAEEVVQTVFTSLARKASTFSPRIILPAWLHRHACLTTRQMMRSARRRQAREEASAVLCHEGNSSAVQIAEVIDEALNSLPHLDRTALALRFLENKDLRSVGLELGVSEDAAQKRVSRGLDRLRAVLERRGVKSASFSMAGVLLSGPANALPPGLGPLAAASLQAATASTFVLPTLTGTIAFLTMKTSTTVTASILVILTGTAAITLMNWRQPKTETASIKPVLEKPVSSISQISPNTPQRVEISTTTGPRFPKSQAASKPITEYDKETRAAFQKHPMTRIAQARINTIRSVTQGLINRITADHEDKLALYQELQTASVNPGLSQAERAKAEAEMEKLSVELKVMEQEKADFTKSMNDMLTHNLEESMQQILAEIKKPSPPARLATHEEISSFHNAENLFLKEDYAVAENMFTPLANHPDVQVATSARWKLLLSRVLQGKENSNEIQPLLLNSPSAACYAMALHTVQQGEWETANLWIAKAKTSDSPEVNSIFNGPLMELGWMDPTTGLLIPPDLSGGRQ